MDIVDKLASAGELTPDQVAGIRERVAAFVKHARKNPSFHAEAHEKLAISMPGWLPTAGKSIGATVGTALALAAANEAMKGGVGLISQVREKSKLRKSYNSMLEMSPELTKYDSAKTQAAFNTLSNFNPSYAKDPLVAGTFVQNALDMDRVDVGTVNSLVDAAAKQQKAKKITAFDAAPLFGAAYAISRDALAEPSMPHPSQVAAWKAQAAKAKEPPREPHPSQVAAWEAQAARALNETIKGKR